MKVEQLERYGKSISDIPKEAFQGQGRIMFRLFKEKFGLWGMVVFMLGIFRETRSIRRTYRREYLDLYARTKAGAKEFTMLVAIFNLVAQRESREDAYEFVKSLFQSVALTSLPAIYQLKDMVRCEGDVFDNFKKFNVAMFEGGTDDFHVAKIDETPDHLRIVVDRCLNVEAGLMFDCPEVAKLGCDHDLASYPFVEPGVKAVFRRPCTLAKGGSCCDFNFYRKGHEPEGDYTNY